MDGVVGSVDARLQEPLVRDAGDGSSRQLRTTARQHLIALYRGLGRHSVADAHRRALAVEVLVLSVVDKSS